MHDCLPYRSVEQSLSFAFVSVDNLRRSILTLARYFSSLDPTVNSTSRAGRATPYATTYTTGRKSSNCEVHTRIPVLSYTNCR